MNTEQQKLLADLLSSIHLYSYTRIEDTANGPYIAVCPFCEEYKTFKGGEDKPTMTDLSHDNECPYKIIDKFNNPENYI